MLNTRFFFLTSSCLHKHIHTKRKDKETPQLFWSITSFHLGITPLLLLLIPTPRPVSNSSSAAGGHWVIIV